MSNKRVNVFVSSTRVDLQDERRAVERMIHQLRSTEFAGMEYFGSAPDAPIDVSLAAVDNSDIYVGIFADRYGSGITEAEYHRARARGIPCLVYLKATPSLGEEQTNTVLPEDTASLDALKRELKQNHTLSFFRSPDDLAAKVAADLHNWLFNQTAGLAGPSSEASRYQINISSASGTVIGDNANVTQFFREDDPK
jgi:hypothetical protein